MRGRAARGNAGVAGFGLRGSGCDAVEGMRQRERQGWGSLVLRFGGRAAALLAALWCIGAPPAAAQMPAAPEIAVLGNGVEIAAGSTRPSTADDTNFESVALLDESGANVVVERTFTIENRGTAVLTLGPDAVSLEARRPGGFRVQTQPAQTVAAGANTTFTIAFDPRSSGVKSAYVSVASDDADENPYRFRVGGNGVEARMGLSWSGGSLLPTGTVDFEELGLGAAGAVRVFTVSNTGRYPLELGDDAVTIDGDADFSVDTQPARTVAAGASTTFTLVFEAAVPGARSATARLAVLNDLLRRPAVAFSLRGQGTGTAVTVTADADTVAEGTAAAFTLTRTGGRRRTR